MDLNLKIAVSVVLLALNLVIFSYGGSTGRPWAIIMNTAKGLLLGYIGVRIWMM